MLGRLPKGLTIGIADAIIAATALELGAPLLANNVEHYPVPGLEGNQRPRNLRIKPLSCPNDGVHLSVLNEVS